MPLSNYYEPFSRKKYEDVPLRVLYLKVQYLQICLSPALLLEHVVTKGVFNELYLSLDNNGGNSCFVAETLRCVPTENDFNKATLRNILWSNKFDN